MTQAIDYVRQAFELKSQNCHKQAIEMLYKALELEPDNIEILSQLGELYWLLSNNKRAKQYCRRVLEANPQHVESLQILRDIALSGEDYEQALECACSAYENSKTTPNLASLVEILSKLGRLDDIKKLITKKTDEAAYFYAKALWEHGEFVQAQKVLENAPQTPEKSLLSGKISGVSMLKIEKTNSRKSSLTAIATEKEASSIAIIAAMPINAFRAGRRFLIKRSVVWVSE